MAFQSLHHFLRSTHERLKRRAFSTTSPEDHLKRAATAGDLHKCLGLAELTFLGTGSIIGEAGWLRKDALGGTPESLSTPRPLRRGRRLCAERSGGQRGSWVSAWKRRDRRQFQAA